MRLDTICFNLGFGTTIAQARQFVNHGHITVNNEVVDIASFQCRIGDKIGVKQNSNSIKLIGENLKINQKPELPSHLTLNTEKIEGEISNHCSREDLLLELNELLVIEYYSRR
jgi:small subunit ribosomal protein S4